MSRKSGATALTSMRSSARDKRVVSAAVRTTRVCARPRFLARLSARGHDEAKGLSRQTAHSPSVATEIARSCVAIGFGWLRS